MNRLCDTVLDVFPRDNSSVLTGGCITWVLLCWYQRETLQADRKSGAVTHGGRTLWQLFRFMCRFDYMLDTKSRLTSLFRCRYISFLSIGVGLHNARTRM